MAVILMLYCWRNTLPETFVVIIDVGNRILIETLNLHTQRKLDHYTINTIYNKNT